MTDKNFWKERYQTKQTGWDVGNVSSPLKHYFDQLSDKNISILIPGCRNAHEAEYLMEQGFTDVTVIDIVDLVVNDLKEKLKRYIVSSETPDSTQPKLKIICGDFFDLKGRFDLVVEQTFFCALDPFLRKKYAMKMHELLKPNGKIAGVLFNFPLTEEGPPFGGNQEEYLEYFSPFFLIRTMEPCYHSIEPRKGRELFIILEKL